MTAQCVALVGPDQQENLALEYLASSAEAAGHKATLIPFNTRLDIDRCVRAVAADQADLVGLGIAFQYAIDDYLELARTLRAHGYRGHLTCGGHVPTFCYEELLRDSPGIDTVVRHEGEQTLVEMLDLLGRGERPRGIPGLVWREDGEIFLGPSRPFVRDLDDLPYPKRRAEPQVTGGVPIATVITSRGCVGDCAYCCIRAFGRHADGPRYRTRDIEAVADEIASLYHDDGVRIILLQDDLFLPLSENKCVDRIRALTKAVRHRGADQMVFWAKGRPETITRSVVEALQEIRMIHLFLGVENASFARLRYLGRRHTAQDCARAISLCEEHGIRPSFNFMLFDPDCTIDDIGVTIDFAEQYLHIPWNICRTELYSGTQLLGRMQSEGRLRGNYRTYGYEMRDRAAELMFRILRVCFRTRAFNFDSLINKLITLSFTRQVHEQLAPGLGTAAASQKIDGLIEEVYRDTVDELRRIMTFAVTTDIADEKRIRDFAVETALATDERNHHWLTRTEKLFLELDARGARTR